MDAEWLEHYVAAWSQHPRAGGPTGEEDLARLLSVMSDDVRYVDVAVRAVHVGHVGVTDMARAAHVFSADLTFAIRSVQSGDDRFAIEWEMRGTHTGAFGRVAGTGLTFAVRGVSAGQVSADGRASAHRDYWNVADWMAQVGLLDLAGP